MTTGLTLILGDDLLARIQAAAAEAGLSPDVWAARVLADSFSPSGLNADAATFDPTSRDDDLLAKQTPQARAFQHAAALEALEEYDRTGEHVTLEQWASEFRDDVKARLAK